MEAMTDGTTRIHWLSFSHDGECIGIILVEAPSLEEALVRAQTLGIDPGGMCTGWTVGEDENDEYAQHLDRLISVEDARELFDAKSTKEWKEAGVTND
jgi:hypothetical protein